MRAIVCAVLLLSGGLAVARPKDEPAPQLSSEGRYKPKQQLLKPIESVVWPLERQRQNVGLPGRINATGEESQAAQTPSLQLAPFSGSLF
jgi:hypothetical protein